VRMSSLRLGPFRRRRVLDAAELWKQELLRDEDAMTAWKALSPAEQMKYVRWVARRRLRRGRRQSAHEFAWMLGLTRGAEPVASPSPHSPALDLAGEAAILVSGERDP
jgi:hypothetical protein